MVQDRVSTAAADMKKLRIYLDTSVINFLFADDAPDFRRVTKEFFAEHAPKYELFVSEVVWLEIARTKNAERRQKLFAVLRQHALATLGDETRVEIENLAKQYLLQKVIPPVNYEDALHVAYATVHQMDILLSWNFKHLANVRRESLIAAVNQSAGYRYPLRLLSPLEVVDEIED
jgi:predicted nucleic acid-binding protein